MKRIIFAIMASLAVFALVGCGDSGGGGGGGTTATVTEVTVHFEGHSEVRQGETTSHAFSAAVEGTGNPAQTVTWSLVGEHDNTAIANTIATFNQNDKTVTVSISADVGTRFRVRAVSTVDTSKSGYSNVLTVVSEDTVLVIGIEIDATNVKSDYFVMDLLDTDGVTVTLVYDDESTGPLTDYSMVTFTPERFFQAGDDIEVTGTYTDGGFEASDTFTVTVSKRTLTASDFQIAEASISDLTGQNIRNTITPIVVESKADYVIGDITVLYADAAALPNKAGTFAITIDVEENDIYDAATGLVLGSEIVIEKVELTSYDIDFTPIEDGQWLFSEKDDLDFGAVWKENTIWNDNGNNDLIHVYYLDKDGDEVEPGDFEQDAWYSVWIAIDALDDYFDEIDLQLDVFQVVATLIAVGEADITIAHWSFTDNAPEITGGAVSRTGVNGVSKTKVIEITGTFAAVEWYLNGVKVADNATNSYTISSAGLEMGGPYFVTVRVQIGSEWFSRTVRFTVNP